MKEYVKPVMELEEYLISESISLSIPEEEVIDDGP